jgi:hypothetical protein
LSEEIRSRLAAKSGDPGKIPHKNEKDIQNLVQVVACDSLAPTKAARIHQLNVQQAQTSTSHIMKLLTIIQTAALLFIAGASVFAGIPDAGTTLFP